MDGKHHETPTCWDWDAMCHVPHIYALWCFMEVCWRQALTESIGQILQNISQFCLACSLLLLIYHYTNVVIIISISITMNGNNHHNCHYHHHVLTMIIIQWCYHYHHNYHEIIVIWFWSSLFMMLSMMLSFIITIITTIMVIFVDDFGSQNDDLTMFCGSPKGAAPRWALLWEQAMEDAPTRAPRRGGICCFFLLFKIFKCWMVVSYIIKWNLMKSYEISWYYLTLDC